MYVCSNYVCNCILLYNIDEDEPFVFCFISKQKQKKRKNKLYVTIKISNMRHNGETTVTTFRTKKKQKKKKWTNERFILAQYLDTYYVVCMYICRDVENTYLFMVKFERNNTIKLLLGHKTFHYTNESNIYICIYLIFFWYNIFFLLLLLLLVVLWFENNSSRQNLQF